MSLTVTSIEVGGGPSRPSIEGPFCRSVYLCRTLGDRKREKKGKKKREKREKNKEKRRKNRDKRERNEKKRKIAEILFIFYALLSF